MLILLLGLLILLDNVEIYSFYDKSFVLLILQLLPLLDDDELELSSIIELSKLYLLDLFVKL